MYHGDLVFQTELIRVLDRWDILIIAGAGYLAIMTLVRLMAARRNQLVDHVRQQISEQHAKRKQGNPESEDSGRGAA